VLSLEVTDDGRGLSSDDLAKARSFGLRGLHERASTVGGWVDLTSGPGGTTLILSVPIQDAASRGAALEAERHGAYDDEGHDPSSWGTL
jgi:glucose-6-phosphate-specific signal transduction histidine kinase